MATLEFDKLVSDTVTSPGKRLGTITILYLVPARIAIGQSILQLAADRTSGDRSSARGAPI
eukprot:SAG31_NODE_35280_length_324_cov_1.373333_1_plen_60_part_10